MMIDPARPTKIDRPSDVTGLVDTGELGTLFTSQATPSRSWNPWRASANARSEHARDDGTRRPEADDPRTSPLRLREGRGPRSTATASPAALNPDARSGHRRRPASSPRPSSTTTASSSKTAAVMKMVIDGYAGAGTISMGGYDYHGRHARPASCATCARALHGRVLEYAARAASR